MKTDWAPKLLLILAFLLVLACLYLIHVRYEARKLQAKLNQMVEMTEKLDEQTRRYQIELATLTDYTKIYAEAIDVQKMVFPDPQARTLLVLANSRAEK